MCSAPECLLPEVCVVPKNWGGLTQKLDSLAPRCSPFLSGMSSSFPIGLASLLSSRPPSGSSQPHSNQAWHLEPAWGWSWLLPRAQSRERSRLGWSCRQFHFHWALPQPPLPGPCRWGWVECAAVQLTTPLPCAGLPRRDPEGRGTCECMSALGFWGCMSADQPSQTGDP